MSKKKVSKLRAKAADCRVTARQSNDADKAHSIFKQAVELEKQAREMEQRT